MIIVSVIYEALLGVWRYSDRRQPRAVPEEIDWLDVAAVVVSTAFIHGDKDCRVSEQGTVADYGVGQVSYEVLVREQSRVRRMSLIRNLRADNRDRRQRIVRDIREDLVRVDSEAKLVTIVLHRNAFPQAVC